MLMINYVILRLTYIYTMITPLSIRAPMIESQTYQLQYTPQINKPTDSLIFSMTSEKYNSQWDTNLLDSKSQQVSKQLQTLQNKLHSLENKVYNITQNSLVINEQPFRSQKMVFKSWYEKQHDSSQKQNTAIFSNKAQIGKIISKKSIEKTIRPNNLKQQSQENSFQGSRNTALSNSLLKTKELSKMKKQMIKIKRSFQKSQRSKSICSDKLQSSKSLVKKMLRQQKKMQKDLQSLKNKLKKSQNIRLKQKQEILRQQKEIQHYKQLLRLSSR